MVDATTPQVIIGGIGAALGGGGISSIINYFVHRARAPSIAQDAINRAVRTALNSTTSEIDRLNAECESLRNEVRKVRDQAALDHEACERRAAAMQAEIDRLMREIKPAAYKRSDLRRMTSPREG